MVIERIIATSTEGKSLELLLAITDYVERASLRMVI